MKMTHGGCFAKYSFICWRLTFATSSLAVCFICYPAEPKLLSKLKMLIFETDVLITECDNQEAKIVFCKWVRAVEQELGTKSSSEM